MAEYQETGTLTGRYVLVPNPCTTDPCLPGLAYAVNSGGREYFLTTQGRWSDRARTWGDFRPSENAMVTVTGRVEQRTDIHGEAFLTIEVESLVRADD